MKLCTTKTKIRTETTITTTITRTAIIRTIIRAKTAAPAEITARTARKSVISDSTNVAFGVLPTGRTPFNVQILKTGNEIENFKTFPLTIVKLNDIILIVNAAMQTRDTFATYKIEYGGVLCRFLQDS